MEIGAFRRGSTDPNAADYSDLGDWEVAGDTIEIRIPWMLLGFTDPSSLSVWDWPYAANGFNPVPTTGVRVEPRLVTDNQEDSIKVLPRCINGIPGTSLPTANASKPVTTLWRTP